MKLQKQKGFTIVELLVVIVVIGILAAITIVSYTGVTAKANTSAAQSNANSITQVVNACVSDTAGSNPCAGAFPAVGNIVANINAYVGQATALTKLPYGVAIVNTATTPLSPVAGNAGDGRIKVGYLNQSTTGACIAYLNFQLAPATNDLGVYFIGTASAYTQTAAGQIATCT